MVRTEPEHNETVRRIAEGEEFARLQREPIERNGFTPEQVEAAMQPLVTFQAQYEGEARWYERAKRGEIDGITRLGHLGRLLIALRIASGLTQRELAHRLAVAESQVSRDERHEYYGITTERADRVLEALGAAIAITAQVEQTRQPVEASLRRRASG